jgi:hypothetical protein
MHTLSDLTLDARGFGTSIITSKAADLMDSRILRIVETYAIRKLRLSSSDGETAKFGLIFCA